MDIYCSAWSKLQVPIPKFGSKQKSKIPFDHLHRPPTTTFERVVDLEGCHVGLYKAKELTSHYPYFSWRGESKSCKGSMSIRRLSFNKGEGTKVKIHSLSNLNTFDISSCQYSCSGCSNCCRAGSSCIKVVKVV